MANRSKSGISGIGYKLVQSQLSGYFDYFQSENSFAKADTEFKSDDQMEENLGSPIIEFKTKACKIKNKEKIYENEIRIIFSSGKVSQYSFDYKNGGKCQKIVDDSIWVKSIDEGHKSGESISDEEDNEWIII